MLVVPQTLYNGMVMSGEGAGDARYRFIASPIAMSAAPVAVRRVPPALGEHTEEVLSDASVRATGSRP